MKAPRRRGAAAARKAAAAKQARKPTAEAVRQNDALWDAVYVGDGAAIEAALRGGADADAKDEEGFTALMLAARIGHAGAAAALLKAGADRAAKATAGRFEGKTALEIATERGNEDVAALLR